MRQIVNAFGEAHHVHGSTANFERFCRSCGKKPTADVTHRDLQAWRAHIGMRPVMAFALPLYDFMQQKKNGGGGGGSGDDREMSMLMDEARALIAREKRKEVRRGDPGLTSLKRDARALLARHDNSSSVGDDLSSLKREARALLARHGATEPKKKAVPTGSMDLEAMARALLDRHDLTVSTRYSGAPAAAAAAAKPSEGTGVFEAMLDDVLTPQGWRNQLTDYGIFLVTDSAARAVKRDWAARPQTWTARARERFVYQHLYPSRQQARPGGVIALFTGDKVPVDELQIVGAFQPSGRTVLGAAVPGSAKPL